MHIVVSIDAPHLNGDDGHSHSEVSSLISAVGFHSKLLQSDNGGMVDEETHTVINWEIETED